MINFIRNWGFYLIKHWLIDYCSVCDLTGYIHYCAQAGNPSLLNGW